MSDNFSYTITAQKEGERAHCAVIKTPHGCIETPNFIFCATHGAIKGLAMEQLIATGAQFVLGNTYHLWQYLRRFGLRLRKYGQHEYHHG